MINYFTVRESVHFEINDENLDFLRSFGQVKSNSHEGTEDFG